MFKELSTLKPYLAQRRWWYIGGILFLLLTSGMQLVIPQFVKHAINTIAAGDFVMGPIIADIAGIGAVALLVALGRIGWRFLIHGASRHIEVELRDRLFTHALSLGRSFYQDQKVGDLMALATNDLNAVRMAASWAFVAAFDGIFMTTSVLIILFGTNPILTLICISPLPLVTLIIFGTGSVVGKLFGGVQESYGVLSRQAQEVFSGVKVVQSFVKEETFLKRFTEANADYRKRNMQLIRVWGLMFPLVGFLSGLTALLLLRFGGEAVIGGSFTPGDLVATLSYLQLLVWPMLGAGFTVNLLQRGEASMGRINQVLNTKSDILTPAPVSPPPAKGGFEFRSLCFAYPGREGNVLVNLNLTLQPGTWLGVTGPIGSGKSTLWQALVREWPVGEGMVFFDGTDITHYEPDELRKRIAVVPQETFLFSESLEANIAFGLDDASKEDIRRAANASTIDRDVGTFPDGWLTGVGERGITLSGGQKQRIAMSRALLLDAALLILDDSFASVDAQTERYMLDRLSDWRRGKSTLIISHRISAMAACDLVVVLDHGTVTQSGPPDELSLVPGFYQETMRLQSLEGAGA